MPGHKGIWQGRNDISPLWVADREQNILLRCKDQHTGPLPEGFGEESQQVSALSSVSSNLPFALSKGLLTAKNRFTRDIVAEAHIMKAGPVGLECKARRCSELQYVFVMTFWLLGEPNVTVALPFTWLVECIASWLWSPASWFLSVSEPVSTALLDHCRSGKPSVRDWVNSEGWAGNILTEWLCVKCIRERSTIIVPGQSLSWFRELFNYYAMTDAA